MVHKSSYTCISILNSAQTFSSLLVPFMLFLLDFSIFSFLLHLYFVAFRILVYFVSLHFFSHFSIFRFVKFRFAFQYISLRNISFRFVSFVAFRFRFVVQYNPNFSVFDVISGKKLRRFSRYALQHQYRTRRRLRVECTLCNLHSRARTHAVLVIGVYELLSNPTT